MLKAVKLPPSSNLLRSVKRVLLNERANHLESRIIENYVRILK